MSARSGVSVAAEATEPASAGVLTFSGGALEEAGEGEAAGGGAATAAALHTSSRRQDRGLRRNMEPHQRALRPIMRQRREKGVHAEHSSSARENRSPCPARWSQSAG